MRFLPLPHALLLALLLAACTACTATIGTQPSRTVVEDEPPPPRVTVQGPAPFPDAVYVQGYWRWNGERYVWQEGEWRRAREGHRFEQPHWEREDEGWVFVEGHWEPMIVDEDEELIR
ncbi:MAG TPA: hypothetical protein RMH85_06625 [Polyangiaceae bacterium LLY-WYZ-15_(1-7)]|nr:hypothetical protein [Myxococcales bacterium]MAT24253.1 hypothetical protein [Sandaracinus sp.]HJK93488.1 hypothetical protein [Polyangiaceae bacterium LLY-WYZ-15_(1-7)]MBJ75174.1 hypothetical protein [Sandaracinus sp.]HJL03759.1 hypothetical protein [Polyangiaceae bacterium LLY-WYZ-15_(1-7)]